MPVVLYALLVWVVILSIPVVLPAPAPLWRGHLLALGVGDALWLNRWALYGPLGCIAAHYQRTYDATFQARADPRDLPHGRKVLSDAHGAIWQLPVDENSHVAR